MHEHAPAPDRTAEEQRRFRLGLIVVLVILGAAWVAYGMAQPTYDPRHDRPSFDAAYYLDWSDAILTGDASDARFEGAFYRAPFYPYLLALIRGTLGETRGLVIWLQMVLALATVAVLACLSFRWGGVTAGIATAVVLGAYQPWQFFSARLLAESWAIGLLSVALALVGRGGSRRAGLAGLCAGLATLARPNLLLVALGWIAWRAWRGERRAAAWMLVATALVILPVTAANYARSGHFVPVSSNGGLTLYHGNGPGAQGVFTHPAGIGGAIDSQRREATAAARKRTGRDLDAVEADQFWAGEAIRERLAHPLDSVGLVWTRLLLLLDNREIALDDAPAIDPNPWRRAAPIPFVVLLACASAALFARRRWAGAAWCWIAIAGCALTPLLFYVSSRYRLPFAVMLAVPAGIGIAELLAANRRAMLGALGALALSLTVPWTAALTMPYESITTVERATGYARLAQTARLRGAEATEPGERDRWERLSRAALARGVAEAPGSPELLCELARRALDDGETNAAEQFWERAWSTPGGSAAARVTAAVNLSALQIQDGRSGAAATLLSEALELSPLDPNLWTNYILALVSTGRVGEARNASERARRLGVPVDAGIESLLSRPGANP